MAGMMNAAVIREPGGPEVLKIEHMWLPAAKQGRVLIQIRAFGLNWSELFTRQGLSPDVKFPRVLRIGAVGLVENAPRPTQVQLVKTQPLWETLGAAPEMLQTSWGATFAKR